MQIKQCKVRLLGVFADEFDTRLAHFERNGSFPSSDTPVAIGPPVVMQFIAFAVNQITLGFALALGDRTKVLWRHAWFVAIGTVGVILVVSCFEVKGLSS